MRYKLSDVIDINPRESIAKGAIAKRVSMDILQPFCRDVPGYTLEEYRGGTKFRNGDTIMARITPCLENGKTAQVRILEEDEVAFGSTEYIVFRSKCAVTDPNYVYYLVCSPAVREPAIKSMVGSSGRQRVQTDVVASLEIDLPDIEVQKKISGILSAIDNKIEMNNKINENLQEQAQALFKSWFIDLDPFGGVVPETWRLGKLKDVLILKKHATKAGANPELPYLPIDIIPMNSLAITDFRPNEEAQSSLLTFDEDDILIGAMRVYFHRVAIAPCAGISINSISAGLLQTHMNVRCKSRKGVNK